MSRTYKITSLAGDGIGQEVIPQAERVLEALAQNAGISIEIERHLFGGVALDAGGEPLSDKTLKACQDADAVLLGAIGDPRFDSKPPEERPERGLLELRAGLGCWANLRPIRPHPDCLDASPLKREVVEGTDFLVVRELASGLYYGRPKGITEGPDGRVAVDTLSYTEAEIERIVRYGFAAARSRRGKLTSVDKANVLVTGRLWREVVENVAPEFSDVEYEHLLVDACAMALITRPRSFDVIVTENTFGDILTDEAAVLTGSMGMLPSASLGSGTGLYEPIHGSAPDIAGLGIANPIAAILSVGMMLDHSLDLPAEARVLREATDRVLSSGRRTVDMATPNSKPLSTEEMGDAVIAEIEAHYKKIAEPPKATTGSES